jgi:hypothetical protein
MIFLSSFSRRAARCDAAITVSSGMEAILLCERLSAVVTFVQQLSVASSQLPVKPVTKN